MKRFTVFAAAVFSAALGLRAPADQVPGGLYSAGDFRRDFLRRVEKASRGFDAEEWNLLARGADAADGRERAELSRIVEDRFAAWLKGREFFVSAPRLGDFIEKLRAVDREHVLELDARGKILRDGMGDPVFRGMENFAADEESRRRGVEEAAESLLARWEEETRAESQELLACLSFPLADAAAPLLAAGIAESLRAARAEFERVARLSESRFLAARLADSFSLGKKSEDAAAEETARRLLAEARDSLADGRERLLAGLPGNSGDAPADFRPDPEKWREDFRREFEKGLGVWSRAEENLIASRLRWETRAGETFAEADAAWNAAEAEFLRSRESWLSRMAEIEEAGDEAWDDRLSAFRSASGRVLTELAGAAEEQMGNLRDEARACLDMYRESSALIEAAAYNGAVLREELENLLRGDDSKEKEIAALREEIDFWTGENGVGPRHEALRLQALEFTAGLEERIRGYGGGEAGDSLEREILRMRSRLALLEETTEAARAAAEYAGDASSNRATGAETAEELRLREADYAAAENAHAAAVESLAEGGRRMSAAAGEIRAAKAALDEAEAAFREARASCEESLSLYRSGDPEVLLEMLAARREEIDLYRAGREDRLAAWRDYAAAGERERRENLLEDARSVLEIVEGTLSGNPVGDEAAEILTVLGLAGPESGPEAALRSRMTAELLSLPVLSAGEGEALMKSVAEDFSGEEARVRREVYAAWGRRAPAFLLMYGRRDADGIRAVVGSALPASPEETAARIAEAVRVFGPPPYLAEAVTRLGRFPGEADFYLPAVENALAVLASGEIPSGGGGEERGSDDLGQDIFRRERRAAAAAEAAADLLAESQALAEDRNAYLLAWVEPKRRIMEEAAAGRDRARRLYEAAAGAFRRGQEEFAGLKAAADAAREGLGAARAAYLRAREIADCAASGYAAGGFSPGEVLKKREAETERTRHVLGVLESTLRSGRLPAVERIDPAYRAAKERETEWREFLQYLATAEEAAAGEGKRLGSELADAERKAAEALRRVFSFVVPGGGIPADGELTKLSFEDEALFARETEEYFSGGAAEAAPRLQADAAAWLKDLSRRDDPAELLREFALAYYYDAVIQGDLAAAEPPAIHVGLFAHPSWIKLLEDHVHLGPGLPFFDGDVAISGEDAYYPPERRTVEDYLRDTAGGTYRKIAADPRLKVLYGFYKMMVVTGNLAGGAAAIGRDVGDAVFAHVDAQARKRQRSCLKWYRVWAHAEGNRIKALRSDIASARLSGAGERGEYAAAAAEFASASERLSRTRSRIAGLGFTGISSAGDLLDALARLAGREPSAAFAEKAAAVFPLLEPAETANVLLASEALRGFFTAAAGAAREEAEIRAAGLLAERRSACEKYRALVEDPGSSGEDVIRAAADLFGNPVFTAEDKADLDLACTKALPAGSAAGGGCKLELLLGDLENLFATKLTAAAETARFSLEDEYAGLEKRRAEWDLRFADLLQTGREGWRTGREDLAAARAGQADSLAEAYRESVGLWNARRELFAASRNEWIQTGAERAVRAGVDDLAADFGLDAERLLADVESVGIPDLLFSASGISAAGAGNRALTDAVLRTAGLLAGRAGDGTRTLSAFLPGLWTPSPVFGAGELAREIEEDVFRGAAFAAAVEWGKAVREAEEGVSRRIAEANRAVENSLAGTLREAGYARTGSLFSRRIVIDETLLGGIERERQSIEGYRFFEAPAFDCGADLSRDGLKGKSGGYITAMIGLARENIAKYLELLFGRDETRSGTTMWSGAISRLKELFEKAESGYRASAGLGRVENGARVNEVDGLFSWHVGYAPVMKKNDPENAAEAGYGELGRIMTAFFRNQARQMRGLASFDIAWYNRKMWDDDHDNDGRSDGFLGAPSVRSAANLAVGIAASATGNVWAAAALNMLDDTAFTLMDAAGGSVGLYSGLRDLGVQAAVGAAGAGFGEGLRALGGAAGGGGVLGNTLLKGAGMLASNAASGAAAAVKLGPGGFSFRSEVFIDAVAGDQALASYAGGLIGTLLAGGVEGLSLRHLAEVRSFADFAGSLAAAGVEYGLTGGTRLNVADFGIFGLGAEDRVFRGGMLEFNPGGGGPLFSFGSGGTDVSLGRILQAAAGAGTWKKNIEIELADLAGAADFAAGYDGVRSVGTALRSLYSYGDAAGRSLVDDVVSGSKNLRVGYTEARGLTEGTAIHLATLGGREDAGAGFRAGIALQHEAHRDGVRVGGLQADGIRETAASNFAELAAAGAARLRMAAGIDRERPGFLASNRDLLFETCLYEAARKTGDEGLYLDYLRETYRNGEDFYFPAVSTNGEYQNSEGYERYPLLAARTKAAVDEENGIRLSAAVDAYILDMTGENGAPGPAGDFLAAAGVTRDEVANKILNDRELQRDYEYYGLKYESIASEGCMLTAAMYGAETLSGRDLRAPEVNSLLREAGLYAGESDLSPELLGRAMELLTGGEYRFELQRLENGRPGEDLLRAMAESPDAYIAHLRIRREGGGTAYHSEMLSAVEWETYYVPGGTPGIRGVRTANPWRGNGYTGRTYRTPGEIARWDVYRAVPTWRYYFARSGEWEIARR